MAAKPLHSVVMMTFDLTQYTLGESDEAVTTSRNEEVRDATLALTQQAKRSLIIFTQRFDNRLYNNKAFYDACLKLATYSRHSLIRILIQDSVPVAKQGNRIVELSYRISSRIQIRKPPVEYKDFEEEFVIADGRGLMHRRLPGRYEGELNFNAAMKARQLTKYFNDCWEKSGADPELRRLSL